MYTYFQCQIDPRRVATSVVPAAERQLALAAQADAAAQQRLRLAVQTAREAVTAVEEARRLHRRLGSLPRIAAEAAREADLRRVIAARTACALDAAREARVAAERKADEALEAAEAADQCYLAHLVRRASWLASADEQRAHLVTLDAALARLGSSRTAARSRRGLLAARRTITRRLAHLERVGGAAVARAWVLQYAGEGWWPAVEAALEQVVGA